MVATILAYLLIALFFMFEQYARVGHEARSLEKKASDRGSTNLLVVALSIAGLASLAAPALNYLQIGRLTHGVPMGWIGIAIALLGITLRLWAYRTLGRFYTRTLRIFENQSVVREGPYRLIRHPGYAGVILMWLGAAMATTNWIAIAIAAVVLFVAYYYRMQAEENMLMIAWGKEFNDYRSHTRKIIPFLY